MSTFNLGVVAPTHKGVYSENIAYKARNIVSYNGGAYMAKKDCQGVSPENTEYWGLMAEAGQGTPIVYNGTLSGLQSDSAVDKTKVYLISNENDTNYFGHMAYWNGSTWVDGGEYQEKEIQDKSVTPNKTNFLQLKDNLWYFENKDEHVTYDKETGFTHFNGPSGRVKFLNIFLEAGIYYFNSFHSDFTGNMSIWFPDGSSKLIVGAGKTTIEVKEAGICSIAVEPFSVSEKRGQFYFGRNEYINRFVKAQFTNESLVLNEGNIPDKLIGLEMLNDDLYNSIKKPNKLYSNEILVTNNHENLTYTSFATGFFLINKNIIESGSFLSRMIFYGMVNREISFYLVHKISSNGYEIIGEMYQTRIGSDNRSEFVFDLDLSNYDDVYLVTNNCSYSTSFGKNAVGFNNVSLSENIFTEGSKHGDWEMYVDIFMNDYKTLDDVNYSEDIRVLNKKVSNVPRTVSSNYLKNLKTVVDEKFVTFNDDFSCTNSIISENGLVCTDYTKTHFKKGTAMDVAKIVARFRFSEDCEFGVYLGSVLGYVNTTEKILNLCTGYGQGNNIPNVSASEAVTFDFVIGHEYVIELIKDAGNYRLKLIDFVTMQEVSLDFTLCTGSGTGGVVTFSGNILCTGFKYCLPHFSYAKVLFLGDSVTQGVGVESDLTKRYCYQLMTKYFGNDGVISGFAGNTTVQGLVRLNEILKLGYEFEYVIVFFGLNDMRNGGSVENWKTNITNLRERIIEAGSKPIVCVPQLLSGSYIASFEEARDFVIAQNWDCIRFDLTNQTGLHPNQVGHTEMYEIACKSLDMII